MSVKIIDETPDPSVAKQIVCPECGVKLEYVPKDVMVLWNGTDYGGGADGARGFKCPKCGGERHHFALVTPTNHHHKPPNYNAIYRRNRNDPHIPMGRRKHQ